MKIELKLYASLDSYLPSGALKNTAWIELENDLTPSDLLKRLNVPAQFCHLLLINGSYVAPSERSVRVLQDKDVVAIWPPVAGG